MNRDPSEDDELEERLAAAEEALEALRRGEADLIIGWDEPLVVRLKSLVEENERLSRDWQSTFDALQDAVWIMDADQRILRSNRAANELFGRSAQEMTGRHCYEIVHGTKAPIPDCPFLRLRQGLKPENQDLLIGDRWFLMSLDPVLDQDHRLQGAVHIFSEITERKGLEEQLRWKNEKLSFLLEVGLLLQGAHEASDLFQVITEGAAKLLAQPEGSATLYLLKGSELHLAATFPPLPQGFPDRFQKAALDDHPHIRKAIETGSPLVVADRKEEDLTAAEKEICDLRGLCSLLYLPLMHKGEPLGVLIVGSVGKSHPFTEEEIDLFRTLAGQASLEMEESRLFLENQQNILELERRIQERDRTEAVLRESRRTLATLIETAPNLIVVTDPEGRITLFNKACEQLTGYRREEVLGRTIAEVFLPPEWISLVQKRFDNPHEPELLEPHENPWITKSGEQRLIEWRCAPLPSADGRWSLMGIGVDVTARRESQERIRQALRATVQAMAAVVEARDPYTAGHQKRVADLARAIALEMGMPEEQAEGLHMAATIHDIGKISVPSEILSKPSRLTELEFKLIKVHPRAGYEILKDVDFPWPIARMVLEHHERVDGSGYPEGLKGERLLSESKILAVADVVESMASHRPYRPSKGIEAALEEIEKNRGHLYDVQAAEACLRLFREKGFRFGE